MPIGQASYGILETRRTRSAAIRPTFFLPGQYREPVPIVTEAGKQCRYHRRVVGPPIIILRYFQVRLLIVTKRLLEKVTGLCPNIYRVSFFPAHLYLLAPRITRTWCVAPSSASSICMLSGLSDTPSSSTDDTPRVTPCGLSMSIS